MVQRFFRMAMWFPVMMTLMACASGCSPPSLLPEEAPGIVPDYRDLVARHNRGIEDIRRVWAFAIVSLRWTENGQKRWEQGEGQLAVELPGRLSLTIGKVHDLLRIGCDDDRYWVIDLSDDPAVAHVGRTAHAASTSLRELNTIVHPQDLIRLLGLLPIDPLQQPTEPAVVWHGQHFMIEPPGTRMRLLLDRETARPVRIDLLNAEGFSRVTARLDRYARLETTGQPPGSWPTVATLIEIQDLETDSLVKVSLTEAVGDEDAIDVRWFELETLIDALNAEVRDLDRP